MGGRFFLLPGHTDFTFESLYPRTPNFLLMLHLGPKGLEEAFQTNPEQFKSDFQAAGLTRSKDPPRLGLDLPLRALSRKQPARPTLGTRHALVYHCP